MKVLIGTPYYRTVHPPFVTSLMGMIFHSSNIIDCAHTFIQGTNASRQRNVLSRTAITEKCDYLLTVDSDMTFPPEALVSLLEADVDVVGGLYTGRLGDNKTRLMLFKQDEVEERGVFVHYDGIKDLPTRDAPFKVAGIGSAFLLVKTKLLEFMFSKEVSYKIGFPFSFWQMKGKSPLGPDLSFCHRLNLLGIDMWVDPRPNIGHIFEGVVYPEYEESL